VTSRLLGRSRRLGRIAQALVCLFLGSIAHADSRDVPPWTDPDDIPLPAWAKSVVPKKAETPIFAAPGVIDVRRGSAREGVSLPLYGAKRGASCGGRWLLVGPLAWICSDAAELSAAEPRPPASPVALGDGLPFRYFFVGREGASGFDRLESARDDAPAQELEPGFAVAITDVRTMHGESWGKTNRGKWVALRELGSAHPSAFHGEEIATLDFAWVVAQRANVVRGPKSGQGASGAFSGAPLGTRVRFQTVPWREQRQASSGVMVRISEDDVVPGEWMHARDLAHPTLSPPPPDLGADERWIDVELASETLVAYEGPKPVFATLVSTGRGAQGSETATPKGTHRIWVKLATTDMGNLELDETSADALPAKAQESGARYSIEDVPYVQFFDKGVGLHAAFWHRDFGRIHSHGCVNLAPLDARRLFGWTLPHLPGGWTAALPIAVEKGTTVRVR
jgi:hypothetical protein